MSYEILHGDCIEQMAKLDEASVDAVVTDPPYGIGFMGKEWDGAAIAEAAAKDRAMRKSLGPESASRPGRTQPRSSSAFGNEAIIAGPVRGGLDFQHWCQAWATEALRVLKPGGHLLAFGGTRTYHRLACAVEDAGFEIRDCIQYLYGSGFPKSLNLDRLRGETFCGCEGEADSEYDLRDVPDQDVPAPLPATGRQGSVLLKGMSQPGASADRTMPEQGPADGTEPGLEGRRDDQAEQGQLQRGSARSSADMGAPDGEGGRVYSRASTDDGAGDRSAVDEGGSGPPLGPRPGEQRANESGALADQRLAQDGRGWPNCGRCGLPVIPRGLGTALKPSHEPIVVARKPLSAGGVNVLANLENGLRDQGVTEEIRWTKRPASDAAPPAPSESSSATPQRPTEATSASPAAESETANDGQPNASDSGPSMPTGERPIESMCGPTPGDDAKPSAQRSSTPTGEPAPAAASESGPFSPSTTSTEAEPPTAAKSTARSTSRSSAKDSPAHTESFAGIATGLTGSRVTARIRRLSDGSFEWPSGLPEQTPGGSTVAANVLEHGTGALNIDECRIDARGDKLDGGRVSSKAEGWDRPWKHDKRAIAQAHERGEAAVEKAEALGRWPANVVLSEEAAAELDEQSGERKAGGNLSGTEPSRTGGEGTVAYGEFKDRREWDSYGDPGGASRFFYCAKTSRAERNAGLEGFPASKSADDGYGSIQQPKLDRAAPRENWEPHKTANHHPTVKPINLMRWLVRLVTPPGGLVLDPFLGSGTTGAAVALEGFDFIGIEREAEYVEIAEARIAFWAEHEGCGVEDVLRLHSTSEREAKEHEERGQVSIFEALEGVA